MAQHGAAWLSRMQRGSVRVRRGSVQGAVWLSSGAVWLISGCGVAQYRVRHGLVERCGVGKLKGAALVS